MKLYEKRNDLRRRYTRAKDRGDTQLEHRIGERLKRVTTDILKAEIGERDA